jgi:CBS domain-containing protein
VADDGRRAFTVGELMHSQVVSTGPDTPVAEAAAAMVREKVGSALIMQGRLLSGILTERDVLKAAASGGDLTAIPVSAWMTRDPQSAEPETPADEAAQIMFLNGFRHLPIVEGRRVCGVVSLRDLFAARISRPSQQRRAALLAPQVTGRPAGALRRALTMAVMPERRRDGSGRDSCAAR